MWLSYNKKSENYVLNIKHEYDLLDNVVKVKKFNFDKYREDLESGKIELETVWTDMIKYNLGFTYPVERLSEGIHTLTSEDILAAKLIEEDFMIRGTIRL